MADILAPLLGFGGSVLSGLFGQSSADAAMAFQKEVLQNRNQWMVQDLKKAGLNPILAAGATSSGSASGATASMDNPGTAAMAASAQAQAMKIASRQQDNQDKLADAQVRLSDAKSAEALANVQGMPSQIDLRTSSAQSNYAQIELYKKQGEEIIQNVNLIKSRLLTFEKERERISAEIEATRNNARKTALEQALVSKNIQIADLNKEGQALINQGIAISNQLKSLGVPKQEVWSTIYGKGRDTLKGLMNEFKAPWSLGKTQGW